MSTIQASTFNPTRPSLLKMIKDLQVPWKLRLFFLQKLPSCWFWGVKVKYCDIDRCEVTVPYNWRTKNPFRSIYFATLCGAGELSTGTLALIALHGRVPISMLITAIEANFTKKAVGLITFTCEEGAQIRALVDEAISTGEGREIKVLTIGCDEGGAEVCRMMFNWSFKAKRKK
jgi:hypothetical protein